VLVPGGALLAFSVWSVWTRDIATFQVVAAAPLAYALVYLACGAGAYRSAPTPADAATDRASSDLPSVSVLVPAHDEENVIANTLRRVLALRYPRLEVIVIDDASTDRTGEIARRFPVRVISRRDPLHRGKADALNAGLAASRGDVVCVFDADSEMAPDFLLHAVAPLADPRVCGVQGQVRMYNRERNALTRVQDDEFAIHIELLQLGRERLHGACALGGNGQLTRRSALEAVGGWSPSALTEDLDLTVRLYLAGCGRIVHATRAVVWQEAVPTVGALVRQRTRWAEGILRCFGEHAGALLRAGRMPFALRLDACVALFSVFLPILGATGILLGLFGSLPGLEVRGLPPGIAYGLTFLPLAAVAMGTVAVSWKRDRRVTLWPALLYVVYLLHWLPAFACALVNVARGPAAAWRKTAHAGPARAPRAAFARLESAPALEDSRSPTVA
jgi:1,2-diacylglycerol 3-beta-glucosyltransferase